VTDEPRRSALATWSITFGVCSLGFGLVGPVAIVLGAADLVRIAKHGSKRKELALDVAGIVLGIAGTAFGYVLWLMLTTTY